jgi:hypothetical protein
MALKDVADTLFSVILEYWFRLAFRVVWIAGLPVHTELYMIFPFCYPGQ